MTKILQKGNPYKQYNPTFCLIIAITAGATLLTYGLATTENPQEKIHLSSKSNLKEQLPQIIPIYAHLSTRMLFLDSIIKTGGDESSTETKDEDNDKLKELNPLSNYYKFKNEVSWAKKASVTVGEKIGTALTISQAIQRLKDGNWKDMLKSLQGGKSAGAAQLLSLLFNDNDEDLKEKPKPQENKGGVTGKVDGLMNGIKGLFSNKQSSHRFMENFNLADDVQKAYYKHKIVNEKINMSDIFLKKIEKYTKLLKELGKGKYSGLISSALNPNKDKSPISVGSGFSSFFKSIANFFTGKHNGKNKELELMEKKDEKWQWFANWFHFSMKQVELETQKPENMKHILLNDVKGLRSPIAHMSKIMEGNQALMSYFEKLGENGSKQDIKESIGELYKHMADSSYKTGNNVQQVARYLKHLKWITSVTKNANLNEFLGTFDVMCQSIYNSE